MKKIQCGGFYVDDEAIETREGKPFLKTGSSDDVVENAKSTGGIGWTDKDDIIHKIDEKYLPEADADPILENAKQTGGIGYTEQGEQTVITWDGDTEGRDSFTLANPYVNVSCYKVAEKESEYPENASVEIAYDGGTESFDVELTEYTGAYAYNVQDQPFVIIASAGDINVKGLTGNVPSDGVYFMSMDVQFTTSLTYGGDTIHKIDEKYLPVIPAAPSDDGTYTLTCTVTDGEPAYSWESAT